MTNPTKGEVTFDARGQTYTFKLGTNAQIMIENKTGMSITKFFAGRSDNNFSASDVRTIFHAGLFRDHKLTEEDVGDLIDDIGAERVAQIFVEAAAAAFPKKAKRRTRRSAPYEGDERTDWDELLKRWLMLGYDHESFWDQTPRTLSLAFDAHNETRRIAHNDRAWLAWHVAALQRAKRVPSLTKLQIAKPQASAGPAWKSQLEGLKHWVQASGGKVIYKQ